MQADEATTAPTEPEATTQPPASEAAPAPASASAFDEAALTARITASVARQLNQFQANLKPPPEPKAASEPQGIDWENDFYLNPKETMERFAQELKEQTTREIIGLYQQENTINEFWQGFYQGAPQLKEHDAVVRAVLQSKEPAWKREGITVGEAYQRLEKMVESLGEAKNKPEPQSEIIDGLAFVQQGKPTKESEEKLKTLSDAIKERQRKFMR